MNFNERQKLIIDILEKQEFVSVNILAKLTACSAATIRRDLRKLAADNQLILMRGGAQAAAKRAGEFMENNTLHFSPSLQPRVVDRKQVIAKKAVDLCRDGDSIFIGHGDCTDSMAEFMANLSLNILTNSLKLVSELINYSSVQCSIIGGVLNGQKTLIPGENEEVLVQYYPCGKIFISTSDHANSGSALKAAGTGVLQKLRNQADELIVLCESSTLNSNTESIISSLADGDVLITDNAVTPSLLSRLGDLGIRCIIAEH
ncbi:MAG: DeoR/GlpR transcriptional regulator [Gammaproteobacteria bacterium]|nr:DeoR/GlpR transcriptional regulator [Gammaproteobacteria bacterium]